MFNDRDFVENKKQVSLYCRWRRALYARAAGCDARKSSRRRTDPVAEQTAVHDEESAVECGRGAGGAAAAAAAADAGVVADADAVPSAFRAVLLEVGCGTSVPRLRWEAEKMTRDLGSCATLIRINLDEPDGCIVQECRGGCSAGALICVRMHARNAIERIHELLVNELTQQQARNDQHDQQAQQGGKKEQEQEGVNGDVTVAVVGDIKIEAPEQPLE